MKFDSFFFSPNHHLIVDLGNPHPFMFNKLTRDEYVLLDS